MREQYLIMAQAADGLYHTIENPLKPITEATTAIEQAKNFAVRSGMKTVVFSAVSAWAPEIKAVCSEI